MSPKNGFTLLELMVVIAIIAFLSIIALPSFTRFFAKAKRTEAYTHLRALYIAQKAYFAEHGRYTDRLTGPESLGWKTEGQPLYTYGFSGKGGINNVIGSSKASSSALKGASVNKDRFKIAAAGDIDGDSELDVLTIDQNGVIKIERDDLS